jgi:hypothetical protein
VESSSDWSSDGAGTLTYTGAFPNRFRATVVFNLTTMTADKYYYALSINNAPGTGGITASSAGAVLYGQWYPPTSSLSYWNRADSSNPFNLSNGDKIRIYTDINSAASTSSAGTIKLMIMNTF